MKNKVVILIPCLNEQATIGKVIKKINKLVPSSLIVVYDNNSTDDTEKIAKLNKAKVRKVYEKGKGNVVKKMFSDNYDANCYIMVDGDDTYDVSKINQMIKYIVQDKFDMVIGKRIHLNSDAYRRGHLIGNKIFTSFVNLFFGKKVTDIFSGYRAFSKKFIKTFPVYSKEFEIEAELTIHALEQRHSIKEVNCNYNSRPDGSFSKLSTYSDGIKILRLIVMLIKDEKPLLFFSFLSLLFFASSISIGANVVHEYYLTGLVERLPSAILAGFLMIISVLSFFSGLLLDVIKKIRFENKQVNYQLFKD